ncbi:dTDP-4-amino-4,6-dideoxygalactose transaminase [Microscilla marina]|uniref:Lipopolysaccharide biosynthesis protein RffA n=1 Tax=Microscilla marina ATCC 23134 TaxID=313606 RepID=A1ZZA9_MICM2|nr:dTDP-4-amino-4,6-dideoxygalactose transaminase [Microscilla marina]EAY24261.1 lipopolysaccharide biosynthesis protein RffA [Microscilla marina ATCC 23134]
MQIPFNKPYFTGKETTYIKAAVDQMVIASDGKFTKKCQSFFEQHYGFGKCLLTTSCTSALELAALLLDIAPGDEVIVPAYTFVSTANAFVRRGARVVFADSTPAHPNVDVTQLEDLITPRTKAIVVVHYAGVACHMEAVMALANKHQVFVIEDAAQAIHSFYAGKPLGSFGHLAAFSFHETKNIICGEGGMLVINDDRFTKRAEIISRKGTNRAAFFRGEVSQYEWVDIGGSFLPPDTSAAFLYAQLERLSDIQTQRQGIWQRYQQGLAVLAQKGHADLPQIPDYAQPNAHIFYIICKSNAERNQLIDYLRTFGIQAVFHYLSLHQSPFYQAQHDGRCLPQSDKYADCLLRLPFFYELPLLQQQEVIRRVIQYFEP